MANTAGGKVKIEWYADQVPHFVEDELDRLYGTLFSSLAWWRITGMGRNVHTYVAREESDIVAVLLCRREGRCVRVLTEGAMLSAEETRCFVDAAFERFPDAHAVIFNAVVADPRLIPRPLQRHYGAEDIIVALPEDESDYISMLGAATRKNLKRHLNRIRRDYPSFEFKAMPGREASDETLHGIVAFNHARMSVKNKVSSLGGHESQTIFDLARTCGYVFTATVDGRLCAGAIAFRFGKHFVSRVNAHDPAFDDYRLGMSCCFLAICEAIKLGGRHFHLMWGENDSKTGLLGLRQDQDRIVVYRSRLAALRQAALAVSTATKAARISLRRWLHASSKQDDAFGRTLVGMIRAAKTAKRMIRTRRTELEAPADSSLAEP